MPNRVLSAIALLLLFLPCVPAWPQASEGAWDAVPMTALKAAAVRIDITPEHPAILAGYAERTGRSTGIHDPLKASVVVFDDGESRAALVGLPGEPVVEYGLGIEHDLAALGKTVFVLGYCTGDAGYVPASHMIDEGGYEAEGPYSQDCERDIRDGVKRLIARLFAN